MCCFGLCLYPANVACSMLLRVDCGSLSMVTTGLDLAAAQQRNKVGNPSMYSTVKHDVEPADKNASAKG